MRVGLEVEGIWLCHGCKEKPSSYVEQPPINPFAKNGPVTSIALAPNLCKKVRDRDEQGHEPPNITYNGKRYVRMAFYGVAHEKLCGTRRSREWEGVMKKTWTLILVTALACVLAGCSSAGTASSEQASAGSAASETASATSETASATSETASATSEAASATSEQGTSSGSAGGEQASSGETIDFATGTPWIASSVEGAVTEETETRIQDDFYLAVNKDDLIALKIPDGFSNVGTLSEPSVQLQADLQKMLEDPKSDSHDSQLACNFYELLLDWDTRNKLGIEPLKQVIEPIEAISTIDDLSLYLVDNSKGPLWDNSSYDSQGAGLWDSGSLADFDDPETNIIAVLQPNLLMADSAEYENETALGTSKREALCELATKMLVKSGYTDEQAADKIKNCLDFEAKIAPSMYTNEQLNGPDFISLANNHYTRAELEKAQGVVPITASIDALGYPKLEEYLVISPDYLDKLNSLYTDENSKLIKDYLIVHTAIEMAGMLDRECYEWDYACNNAITGTTGMLSDEEKAAQDTASKLEWPTARLYADTYLTQEDKDRISKLTDDVIAEYHDILADADFLSEKTKTYAIEKLDAIKPHVLYPDNWDQYSSDDLNFKSASDGGTLSEALDAIREHDILVDAELCSKPVDRDRWTMPPTFVNCSYDSSVNGMFIFGAFARCNVYHSDMSDEEMYAKMGVVIGHEISHAFDSSGAQFDKTGKVANWWADEDLAAFEEKNANLEAYFNAMHPWEGQDFHGSIMTGEACADMAGVKCILNIAKKKKDFDYDTFFRAFANLWLIKDTVQRARLEIEDVHPMPYLRINTTLQQYDEFLDCYDIAEGDKMYLAPEDRVAIW